jgi:hypothetical protein
MTAFLLAAGILLIALILWDTFETVVLPRMVSRTFRLSRYYYRFSWRLIAWLARKIGPRRRREAILSIHAPLSLLVLLAVWAFFLIFGFALVYEALDHADQAPGHPFTAHVYMSGSTFFTLGIAEQRPETPGARFATITEAGLGFGFLAVVISYLPVLYTAFARREANVSLLSSRAGTPPSATALIERYASNRDFERLRNLLEEWERWSAELLENYVSYPVLAYYRSQQDRQSWLAALTIVLDASSLLQMPVTGSPRWSAGLRSQAELTYSMSVRLIVVLATITNIEAQVEIRRPRSPRVLSSLRKRLAVAGLPLSDSPVDVERLERLLAAYEPDLTGLAERLMLEVPALVVEPDGSEMQPEKTVADAARLV